MTETTTLASVEVHPSVLFRLGRDLISDEVQALAELVKNAYDADSHSAVVRIVTTQGPDDFPDDKGYVAVIDNGHGMTIDQLCRGWLTVSNSIKHRMKERGETTPYGRTPLGDKGLGRLGAQRLGNRLTIITTPEGEDVTHKLSFDWRQFRDFENLSDVKLSIQTTTPSSKKGTTIVVSDLHTESLLEDAQHVEKILAKIVSPYRGVMGFKVRGSIDGIRLDFRGLETRIRNAAVIHYDLIYIDDKLTITGRMRLNHLRPNKRDERPDFDRMCEKDNGRALLEFLLKEPLAKDFHLALSGYAGWWVEFERTVRLAELNPVLISPSGHSSNHGVDSLQEDSYDDTTSELASPGPFFGEVDAFNLSAGAAERTEGYGSINLLRQQIKELAGIRIYRDGFNIRTEDDWLGLGRRWTSGRSWYGLRPGTTLGYLELSARDNSQLIETTDREGFTRTPHFDNFEKVMHQFVDTSHEVQEFIGRSWAEFRQSYLVKGDKPRTPRQLTKRLGTTLSAARDHRTTLEQIRSNLAADGEAAEEIINRVMESGPTLNDDTKELISPLVTVGQRAAAATGAIEEFENYIAELESQQRVGDQLQGEFDSLEEQLTLTYETMGVGLIAEALSHEIANIADRLARRTGHISQYLVDTNSVDHRMINFVEHVRGSVTGLRRQIAHLAPSLRYVREKRDRIALPELLKEVKDYFMSRWAGENLIVKLSIVQGTTIVMNRGKVLQVFDNLLLNSEYWLREEVRMGRIRRGEVTIEVDGTTVKVSDNGLGVDSEIEHSLFEPFTTRKPRGQGRGLGLFISARLLESDGCSLTLSSERNSAGRRNTFIVDLAGASGQ